MGQQQLLLIVLGIIIVGIAIAVGVTTFRSSAVDANRAQVISDLNNIAAKAQRHYRTPASMGGGGQDFIDFAISPLDTSNANGSYRLNTSAPTVGGVSGVTTIGSSADSIYVVGWGTEIGNDGSNRVQAYVVVSRDAIRAVPLN